MQSNLLVNNGCGFNALLHDVLLRLWWWRCHRMLWPTKSSGRISKETEVKKFAVI